MAPYSAELDEAEAPLIAQLTAMGWTHLRGSELSAEDRTPGSPILEGRVRRALRRINRKPGQADTWLDEATTDAAVQEVRRLTSHASGVTLEDTNRTATTLLLSGTQLPGPDGELELVRFVDWTADTDAHDFLAVSQFSVAGPGGHTEIPDLVLFVNGLPLAVVECKSPDAPDPLDLAISDLRAYSGNPLEDDERTAHERPRGIPGLFAFAQLLVAANGEDAVLGTISADEAHYHAWRSVQPDYDKPAALQRELRRVPGLLVADQQPNGQHVLTALVFRPANLLNILRHYVIELPITDDDGEILRRVKTVCRHQQYRASEKIVRKLANGRNPTSPGVTDDERGGVVWHTQGSGKSLTMACLARRLHMHRDPELNGFTILVVTDRTQLQGQLNGALQLSGSEVVTAGSQADVESLLEHAGKPGGRRVIFAMIQKYLGRVPGLVLDSADREERDLRGDFDRTRKRIEAGEDPEQAAEPEAPEEAVRRRVFRRCSDSHRVLVLVDEAHRSHASVLHACLRDAVPNAARVGFTGTPIMRGNHLKHTSRIFGTEPDDLFLDTYRMEEAETDGVVVPVRYEGRTGKGEVSDADALDGKFDNLLQPLSDDQQRLLRRRWSQPTARDVAESAPMIRAKARDMLNHYVTGALDRGFKAQLAAVSRRAAVMYRHALRDARAELLAEIEDFDPEHLRDKDVSQYTERELLHLRAWQYRAVLRRIDFVPVISEGRDGKDRGWRQWTDPARQEEHIKDFRQPLPHLPPDLPWEAAAPEAEPNPPLMGQVGRMPSFNPWGEEEVAVETVGKASEAQPVAFLIVKSMLLTGFDAPIEQVLYLDRPIRDAELLQAVARVNRPAREKTHGRVVDYYGVLDDLTVTLAAYRGDPSVQRSVRALDEDLPALRVGAQAVRNFLDQQGITQLADRAGLTRAVLALKEEETRARYDELLSEFHRGLDRVLPHEAALAHIAEAKAWTLLQKRARRLYRDAQGGVFSLRPVGRAVRSLIADHLQHSELSQQIVPVSITDLGFDSAVESISNAELAAAEQVHGLRYHLEQRERRERPELYRELSEGLEEVLREFDGRWERISEQVQPLIETARAQNADDPESHGLTRTEYLLYKQLSGKLTHEESPFGPLLAEQVRSVVIAVESSIVAEVSLHSYRDDATSLSRLEDVIWKTLRTALRSQGAKRDISAEEDLSTALAGHVQGHLSHYRQAGNM